MSATHHQSISISSAGGSPVSGSVDEAGSTDNQIDQVFASGSSGALLTIAFTVAGLQSIVLVSTQNMTIKTNSNTSPGNTINLVAGVPFIWSVSSGYFANPFTADVTAFYITCTASSRLRGKVLSA